MREVKGVTAMVKSLSQISLVYFFPFISSRAEDVTTVDVRTTKDLLRSGHHYLDVKWDLRC